MQIHIPTPEEFEVALQATTTLEVPTLTAAIQRDIARMIEIAHLVEDVGFLGSGAALTGGVAMRLRGSSRLSIKDTDLATTPGADVSDDDLLDALEFRIDEIEIEPKKVTTSGAGDTREVFPVRFRFSEPPVEIDSKERSFRVDVAARGLHLETEMLELRHDYPFALGIEGIKVPTVALVEAVAEKVVAYGIYRLAKHFSDLAYAADHFQPELIADKQVLREITASKLDRNLKQFSRLMAKQGISDYKSLEPPFKQNLFLAAVKMTWADRVGFVGEASEHYSFKQAKELVETRLVPLLFD